MSAMSCPMYLHPHLLLHAVRRQSIVRFGGFLFFSFLFFPFLFLIFKR
jgi:hypothetical protein